MDHKTAEDSFRTTVLLVALVIACLIAVVCGCCCCIACTCYVRKFSAHNESTNKQTTTMDHKTAEDKRSVVDEETKGVYDTIEYDDIAGYEIPDHVFSHDGLNRSYDVVDVPFKDRIPSDYEDADEALNADDDDLTFLSSQYITTLPDPDKETTLTNDPEDKYTPLRYTDAGNRKSEEGAGNEQASYLEIVGDEDERKTTRGSGIGRRSSSSEGSEENNKAPEATANYTQLMPESGYTRLVL